MGEAARIGDTAGAVRSPMWFAVVLEGVGKCRIVSKPTDHWTDRSILMILAHNAARRGELPLSNSENLFF
jgi:hypothetical protein